MTYRWIATALSAILPGAGQLFNHHWMKGTAFLIGTLIASGMLRRRSVLSSGFTDGSMLHLLLLALLLVLAVWSAADAFRSTPRTTSD